MALYSGKDGSITFENKAQGRIRNWSISTNVDMLDATNLGDGARRYEAGLKSATGSATIMYHNDNFNLRGVIDNCITTGTPTAALLSFIWGTKNLNFNAFVNSVSITCTTGEIMTADISFTMTENYLEIDL